MAPMEIQVIKSVSEFEWNHELVKSWARQYAEQYVGLEVTEENLKEMEEVRREIAGKRSKLDEFRKNAKKEFEAPLKKFEAEVKDVMAVLNEVEAPLAEQINRYEAARREKAGKEVAGWIETMTAAAGLRPGFAKMVSVIDKYTLKTATKKSITSDISQRIETLLQMQKAEDEAEELRAQKIKMAQKLCVAQSKAFELTTPITIGDVPGLEGIELGDLAEYIVGVAQRRKQAEEAATAKAQPAKTEEKQEEKPEEKPKEVQQADGPLFNLTMEFTHMTVQQAVKLKAYLDGSGIDYKTVAKVRVA
jgi:phage protein U